MEVYDLPHVFSYIMGLSWDLLSFDMPGINGTGKDWVIICIVFNLTLAALSFAFGLGGNGTGYRSGDSRKKYISEKRRGDER